MTGHRGLPRGRLDVVWHDRWQRSGTVVFIADRRPVALNDAFFRRQIPRWRRLGLALDLQVYEQEEK